MNKSTLQRNAEIASKLVYYGSVEQDIIYNLSGNFIYLNDTNDGSEIYRKQLKQCWAEQKTDGEETGQSNVSQYKTFLDKWIDIVGRLKEQQMIEMVMLQTIRPIFPRNCDYPSEIHMNNTINARKEAQHVRALEKKVRFRLLRCQPTAGCKYMYCRQKRKCRST